MQGLDMFWSSYPLSSPGMGQFVVKIAAVTGITSVLKKELKQWESWWFDKDIWDVFGDAYLSGCIKTIVITLKYIKKLIPKDPRVNTGFLHALLWGHLRVMTLLKLKCGIRQEIMEVAYNLLADRLSRAKDESAPTKIRSSAKKLLIRWGCKLD